MKAKKAKGDDIAIALAMHRAMTLEKYPEPPRITDIKDHPTERRFGRVTCAAYVHDRNLVNGSVNAPPARLSAAMLTDGAIAFSKRSDFLMFKRNLEAARAAKALSHLDALVARALHDEAATAGQPADAAKQASAESGADAINAAAETLTTPAATAEPEVEEMLGHARTAPLAPLAGAFTAPAEAKEHLQKTAEAFGEAGAKLSAAFNASGTPAEEATAAQGMKDATKAVKEATKAVKAASDAAISSIARTDKGEKRPTVRGMPSREAVKLIADKTEAAVKEKASARKNAK